MLLRGINDNIIFYQLYYFGVYQGEARKGRSSYIQILLEGLNQTKITERAMVQVNHAIINI